MIKLDISNFRIIQNAQLYDDTPLSVVMGYNEDGKTSLTQALKFVFVGEAYGHRGKNVGALATHGETKMSVRLTLGNLAIARTQASGDTLVSIANRLAIPADVLPVLFDAKMAGDGGNKALKAFLDTVASTRFNALVHFAEVPTVYPAVEQAIKAGKATTKHIIDYCEAMRALQKTPTPPTMPSAARPSAADLAAAEQLVQARRGLEEATRTALAEATKLGQDLGAIVHYRAAVAAWEAVKAVAVKGDALAAHRMQYEKVAAINEQTLQSMASILIGAGLAADEVIAARDAITRAKATVNQALAANPLPPNLPAAPVLGSAAAATLASLGGAPTTELLHGLSLQVATAGVGLTSDAAMKLAELRGAEAVAAAHQRTIGSWASYDAATEQHVDNVARANAEWARWDTAAKEIAAAADEHVAKTGDSFGKLVAEMSTGLLQGRAIKIDPDLGIFLGPEPIGELSESTKWRTEIAVMAAVARACKSPLLLIDGADILDTNNRAQLFDWLALHITPHFQHTILTATCRGDIKDEAPLGSARACKFSISRGVLTKLG